MITGLDNKCCGPDVKGCKEYNLWAVVKRIPGLLHQSQGSSEDHKYCGQVSSSLEEADVVAGMEDLKLTSKGGRPLTLTPEQLRTMTREQLISIWKDYVNQLAVLLVEVERGDNPSAADTIKQYIEEVVRLPSSSRNCRACFDYHRLVKPIVHCAQCNC